MKEQKQGPKVIAVTSGKGGVGKTNIAVNLAVSLRLLGAGVLVLDADMGLSSVDVLLGLRVRYDLRDVLLHGRELEQVVVEGPRGVKILPAASGVEAMARLSDRQMEDFLAALLRYCGSMDYVVADTAPGIGPSVVSCLLAADEVVLITNPEPTALTDAYALLKLLRARSEAADIPAFVVMNRVESKEEALGSFDRLRRAAERFLGWSPRYLGSVWRDETVELAVKRQVDFLTHYTAAACSRDVRKLAARLVSSRAPGAEGLGRFFRKIVEGEDGRSAQEHRVA